MCFRCWSVLGQTSPVSVRQVPFTSRQLSAPHRHGPAPQNGTSSNGSRMKTAVAPRGWHVAVLPDSLTPPPAKPGRGRKAGAGSGAARLPPPNTRGTAPNPRPPLHRRAGPARCTPGAARRGRPLPEARCTPGTERRPAGRARCIAATAATSHAPARPSAALRPYLKSWPVSLVAAAGVKWRWNPVTGGPRDGTPTPSGRVMVRVAHLTPRGGRGGEDRGDPPLPAP